MILYVIIMYITAERPINCVYQSRMNSPWLINEDFFFFANSDNLVLKLCANFLQPRGLLGNVMGRASTVFFCPQI